LRSGRFDAIALVDLLARRDWALFARSHATPVLAIYHLAAQAPPQSLQALAGQTVALSGGEPMRDTHATFFAGIDGRFIELPTPLAALQAVASGQAALAVLPRAYGDGIVAAGSVPGVVAADLGLRLQPYAFAVAPGNEALRDRLQSALDELERSGKLEALRLKWLGSHRDAAAVKRLAAERADDRLGFTFAALGGLAALGALAWQLRKRVHRAQAAIRLRHEAEAALARTRAQLEQAFGRHPDAMLVAGLESGEVQDVNDALCRLLGWDREALIGERLKELPALGDPMNLHALRDMLDRDGSFDAVPLTVRRADGQARLCLVTCELMQVGDDRHVFSILRDVTEQMQANEALRDGYADLSRRLADMGFALEAARTGRAQAEASATDYTATVAHDLKAPLRAVRGFTGLLRGNLDAGRLDQARSNAEQIDSAAGRMEKLITALARLAQIERKPLLLSKLDMRAMALAAWALIIASQPHPGVELVVDDVLPSTLGDADLVMQVWQNLLDNACKFAAPKAQAKVGVDSFAEGPLRWYRITDNGVGFDPEHASRLFLPFQRLHSARTFEGTGIGLSQVQRIVRRHGGEVRVRSQVSVGTVVEFTLESVAAA
jgi:PAS domain S-box-containing protein